MGKYYDFQEVKDKARGVWANVLSGLGVDASTLTGVPLPMYREVEVRAVEGAEVGSEFRFPPMMGIVRELRFERPFGGVPKATAQVMLFDQSGAETWVEVPVTPVAHLLDHRTRWVVEVHVRALGDGEKFPPQ